MFVRVLGVGLPLVWLSGFPSFPNFFGNQGASGQSLSCLLLGGRTDHCSAGSLPQAHEVLSMEEVRVLLVHRQVVRRFQQLNAADGHLTAQEGRYVDLVVTAQKLEYATKNEVLVDVRAASVDCSEISWGRLAYPKSD